MLDPAALLALPPYGLAREEKRRFLTEELTSLSRRHAEGCPEYAKMLAATGTELSAVTDWVQIPPLPDSSTCWESGPAT